MAPPAKAPMTTHSFSWSALLFPLAAIVPASPAQDPSQNWPQFRGAHAQGIAEGTPTPVEWDVDEGKNVAWKTPIPGLAHSSPIVWGD